MPRKLILDIDPGIDDAISLAIALFDPRLDILAVTATGGSVSPQQATANVQALVALLDPPKLPRLGAAPTDVAPIDHPWNLHGADGLGGLDLPRIQLHGEHAAEKVIVETLRAHPREVTILALGPLTNIARVLRRDPGLAEIIAGIIVCGCCCWCKCEEQMGYAGQPFVADAKKAWSIDTRRCFIMLIKRSRTTFFLLCGCACSRIRGPPRND